MTSSEAAKLNFYSKYNRVREKQDIESLYALIDEGMEPSENLMLTLSGSRIISPPEESPPSKIYLQKQRKDISIIPTLNEQEDQERVREMQEKLRTLERIERNFHEQLDRSEKEYRKKQELKDVKKKQRENYRRQLIDVIEHTSEHSQHSNRPYHHPSYIQERQAQERWVQPQKYIDDEDDYYIGEINLKEENDFDVKETRRKLKEIIQMQRKREREVQSVQENNDVKTSSIVIERLNIVPKIQETAKVSPRNIKEVINYCQVELSHSQSANILRVVRSFDKLHTHENSPQAQDCAQVNYQQMDYEEINLNCDDTHHQENQNEESHQYQQENHQPQSQIDACRRSNKQSGCNYDGNLEYSQINPPLTLALTQQNGNNPLTGQDASELKEEIADHVRSIGDLSEQQSQSPVSPTYRGPLFFSQTHPRQTLHNQHEVQSIAESTDFHPLESQMIPEAQSQIIYGKPQPEATPQPGDRKTSFKKLMAENRANLVPRLAISTILNEYINQALGDYRAGNTPIMPASAAVLHESIISSEGSAAKPAKVNFKNLLRRNKMGNSRVEKKSIERDPVKIQTNKNLLLGFFDEN